MGGDVGLDLGERFGGGGSGGGEEGREVAGGYGTEDAAGGEGFIVFDDW